MQATHAFIIGVGDYPFAKPDVGTKVELGVVRDLASAADSAKLMCDWLIDNRDKLAAPLGSIEVLISDVDGGATRYAPRHPALGGEIERADSTTVQSAGKKWLDRIEGDPGSTAFFFACGHGANNGTSPILFLSDLNQRSGGDAWAHLNVGSMAMAFRQMPRLAAGFFFLDACGEFVPNLPTNIRDKHFIQPDIPKATDRDKVWLFAAASAGVKAYPGTNTDAVEPVMPEAEFDDIPPRHFPMNDTQLSEVRNVKFGRFTQTLIKGLSGAVALWDGAWCVDNKELGANFTTLHRICFPSWNDKPFEPTDVLTINNRVPIVRHGGVKLPVVVLTDPANRTIDFDLLISETNSADRRVDGKPFRDENPYVFHVSGDVKALLYALAIDDAGACYWRFFTADRPHFDHRVPLR